MMKHLLDTCVISELVARKPNPKVVAWIDGIDPESVYLSVITIGEIKKGIEKLPESKRKASLQTWLTKDLLIQFSGRILTIDIETVLTWGTLLGSLELHGKKMSAIDSLIAASAHHNQCRLVTRNAADFIHAGIDILNPWE